MVLPDGKDVDGEKKEEEDDSNDLLESIAEGLKTRTKFFKLTKPFAEKTIISRGDLLLLDGCVASFDALKVIDKNLPWITKVGSQVVGKL